MNTKCRLFVSCFTALALTTSLAMADPSGHSKSRTTKVRAAKTTTVSSNQTAPTRTTRTYRSSNYGGTRYSGTRNYSGTRTYTGTRNYSGTRTYSGNRSSVYIGGSYGYGYGYPYSYGYYPYGYGYGSYPYGYNYGFNYYPGDYTYGYYSSGGYNGSVVFEVQRRLARAGYYRGPIDGVMGPGTRWAIRAYERDHGLRMDGTISGPLIRNMGLRY